MTLLERLGWAVMFLGCVFSGEIGASFVIAGLYLIYNVLCCIHHEIRQQ